MAATYGRLTGKVAVSLATLGPGAINLVTTAAYAQLGAMPMMMNTGQKPVKKSKQGRFQIVDIVEMMRPITKFTKQVVNGQNVPVLVREAVRIAEQERPGAVHLEPPEDIAAEEAESAPFTVVQTRRPTADPKEIAKASEMIRQAEMPLLLIGAAANRNRTSVALTRLVERSGLYFFNTQRGKGVVDERHARFLGTAALSEHDYLHFAIDRADLIINIGHDAIEKPPFFMEAGKTQVSHINNFPSNVDDVYFPQLDVVGDIATTVEMLADHLDGGSKRDFEYFARVKDAVEEHVSERSQNSGHPILPQFLVANVREAMPDDGIIALDNGVYKIWFARNYKAYRPSTVLLDNALAGVPVSA